MNNFSAFAWALDSSSESAPSFDSSMGMGMGMIFRETKIFSKPSESRVLL